MKLRYFTAFILLTAACRLFGQDIVVTQTGDSLKCKIIDITDESVNFRFGNDGNTISMAKDEVVYYKYNFEPAREKPAEPVREDIPRNTGVPAAKPQKDAIPPVYVAVSLGYNTFGSLKSYENNADKITVGWGVDAAYFVGKSVGIGVRLHTSGGKFSTGNNEKLSYDDRATFIGAGLFGRWGGKFAVTSGIAAGYLICSMSNATSDRQYKINSQSAGALGGMFSVGVNCMLTRNIGVGAGIYGTLGSVNLKYRPYGSSNGDDDDDDDDDDDNSPAIDRQLFRIGAAVSLNVNF